MRKPLRVLLIEDSQEDAGLLVDTLTRAGWDVDYERVETSGAMREALARGVWDLVISDFEMPEFRVFDALELLRASELDLPFLVASGVVGEETAADVLRAGAHDFIAKGRFARLGPAVERELREAELRRELRASREVLVRTERLRSLGLMAAGISHDLRNILYPISLRLELLGRALDANDVSAAKAASMDLDVTLQSGLELLDRLWTFSRQEPSTTAAQPVDLNAVAREAITIARPRMSSRGGALSGIVEDLGSPPLVMGKSDDLIAALVNLLVNAMDAMPDGGTITVHTGQDDGGGWVSVADTGPGMTEDVRVRLFEPFFTTKGADGTGLGLAMTRATMQRHRGTVSFETAPGQGSSFKLWLPSAA